MKKSMERGKERRKGQRRKKKGKDESGAKEKRGGDGRKGRGRRDIHTLRCRRKINIIFQSLDADIMWRASPNLYLYNFCCC